MSKTATLDRRISRMPNLASAEDLLRVNADCARRQLAAARDQLIASRRRVVALETAVDNWVKMSELAEVTARPIRH